MAATGRAGKSGVARSQVGRRREHRGKGGRENGAGGGVEPEGVVVLTAVAALDAEAAVRSGGWGPAMSRTGTKAQDARARARAARLALLAERNAQDERIEAAVAAALLAWEDRTAAAAKVEEAERETAAGLALLSREKVLVRDMAALTGIGESVCSRLLKMPAANEPANGMEASEAQKTVRMYLAPPAGSDPP